MWLGSAYMMLVLAVVSTHTKPGEAPPWPWCVAFAILSLLIATIKYWSARKLMQFALDKHGHTLQAQESAWIIRGRIVRNILLHISAISYLMIGLMMSPGANTWPNHPATWTFFIAGIGALTLTTLPKTPTSQAEVVESLERSAESVRPIFPQLADALVAKTQEIAALNNEAAQRAAYLQTLHAVASKQHENTIAKLTGMSTRRARRQLTLGLLLGIPIGLVVNWTSQPLLDVLAGLFR
jgi:hypothetical protein